MKKILIIAMSLTILFVFVGCNDKKTTTSTNTTSETIKSDYIIWDKVSEEELLNIYWKESTPISCDTDNMSYHYTDDVTWLEDTDKTRYYNPHICQDNTILYLDKGGYIRHMEEFLHIWTTSNSSPSEEAEFEIILSSPESTIFWSPIESTLIEKIENKTIKQIDLPLGSYYCGYSYWCGFIFMLDNEVYAVHPNDEDFNLIATGVEKVIACDFKLTSDAWSNPLFLMEDGSLKGFESWGKNDEGNIIDFQNTYPGITFPYINNH